jgi:hypothetical protein
MLPSKTRLSAATFVVLAIVNKARPNDEKELDGEIAKDFQQFAAAVKADKFDEVARWIAPPADKVWAEFIALRAVVTKYDAVLDQKFGKGKEALLDQFMARKGDLAEHFYEVKGEIRKVQPAGKDRAHVVVWTKLPEPGSPSEIATHERKFTAVNVDGQWKFQLYTTSAPVQKKVKRTGPDGKEIEVYAPHDPNGSSEEKDWEEIKKPNSYDGKEAYLKEEAADFSKAASIVRAQTDEVMKGTYATRREAQKELRKALEAVRSLR